MLKEVVHKLADFLIENLPVIITFIGNIIFYYYTKGVIDKNSNKNKVAYSEVFKEKVNIYRDLLREIYELKKKLGQFQWGMNDEQFSQLKLDMNNFNQLCLINQPFISDAMFDNLKMLLIELQDISEKFYSKDHETKEYITAINKYRDVNTFKTIEDKLLNEMRKNLRLTEFD